MFIENEKHIEFIQELVYIVNCLHCMFVSSFSMHCRHGDTHTQPYLVETPMTCTQKEVVDTCPFCFLCIVLDHKETCCFWSVCLSIYNFNHAQSLLTCTIHNWYMFSMHCNSIDLDDFDCNDLDLVILQLTEVEGKALCLTNASCFVSANG